MRPFTPRVIECLKAVYVKLALEGCTEVAVRDLLSLIGELGISAVHKAIQELEKPQRYILESRFERKARATIKFVRFAPGGKALARQILVEADALPQELPSS